MTEEQVTKSILNWLEMNGWEIICFDFPQSGTGVSLHPNKELRTTKNKGAIIPDIVAFKEGKVVFFENKDKFVIGDFLKINDLKQGNAYSASIEKLLKDFTYSQIFFGVGLAHTDRAELHAKANLEKVDFVVFVNLDLAVVSIFDAHSVF